MILMASQMWLLSKYNIKEILFKVDYLELQQK